MNKLDLSNKGAGVLGGIVGAAVGLVGGPVGSIAGGAVGSIVADTFKDFAGRMLSSHERIRFDSATSYIEDSIKQAITTGRSVRQDDFFQGDNNFSSDAGQLLEGVLLKCKQQYEQKKIRLIANIFKNVAFDETIAPQTAYQNLSWADTCTYHDLCVLAYYGRKEEFTDFSLYTGSLSDVITGRLSEETLVLAQDIFILYTNYLIEKPNSKKYKDRLDIEPTGPILSARGKTIFKLLDLNTVPKQDIETTLGPFTIKPEWRLPESLFRNKA
jgi:hypothetical protein